MIKPFAVMLLAVWVTACATGSSTTTLYQQLGGEAGVARIVEAFLYRLADDERINERFADTDIDRFQRLLNEQICALSGGPCKYTGDSMREAHKGQAVDNASFNALVEDFIFALNATNTPIPAQNRLLALLAPMHKDIVEK